MDIVVDAALNRPIADVLCPFISESIGYSTLGTRLPTARPRDDPESPAHRPKGLRPIET